MKYFHDLTLDPTETSNFIHNDSYSNTILELFDRLEYWNSIITSPDTSDTKDSEQMYEVWDDCQCVQPWIENYYEPTDTSIIFSNENSPNIVFILVDDWGWNDIGFRSTYLNWTTPTIDKIAKSGVVLTNYFTHDSCTPSRGAFLTGRSSIRLGLWNDQVNGAELPLSEFTLAQELKTAGYRNYLVGKWHLGMSSLARTPTYRGFDNFYGYYNGFIDYYDKSFTGYLDLQSEVSLVSDPDQTSSTYHNAFNLQRQVESFLSTHASRYSSQPFFLYYALQLIHFPYDPPSYYADQCSSSISSPSDDDSYASSQVTNEAYTCAYNLLLDEVIANLTCLLVSHGFGDNTLLVLASDNGGESFISGNSVPFRGHKFDVTRGGVSATAIIGGLGEGPGLLPTSVQGGVYEGQMHVTDWLPTLMHVATNGAWNGSYVGAELDGTDMWTSLSNPSSYSSFFEDFDFSGASPRPLFLSPRSEIVHWADGEGAGSIQIDLMKLDVLSDDTEDDDDGNDDGNDDDGSYPSFGVVYGRLSRSTSGEPSYECDNIYPFSLDSLSSPIQSSFLSQSSLISSDPPSSSSSSFNYSSISLLLDESYSDPLSLSLLSLSVAAVLLFIALVSLCPSKAMNWLICSPLSPPSDDDGDHDALPSPPPPPKSPRPPSPPLSSSSTTSYHTPSSFHSPSHPSQSYSPRPKSNSTSLSLFPSPLQIFYSDPSSDSEVDEDSHSVRKPSYGSVGVL